jgi:hypothetical protein
VSSAKIVLARKFEAVHRKTVHSKSSMPTVCRHLECRHLFAEDRSVRIELKVSVTLEAGDIERERRPLLSSEEGRFMFMVANVLVRV